ncbi:MAG: 4a-hydroxytetrahydrobiopterin dehydratase [Vampirovibrionales bacterium]|nr:4a-hydroxytetrahydrobiopterin dehydratase [Vampirovibrionales bacterium]
MAQTLEALTLQQLKAQLAGLDGWHVNEAGHLVRVISNPNYKQGLAWVQAIGDWAEAHDHHPDVLLTWPTLTITFYTHTANGVTEKDVEAAQAVNSLIPVEN